MKYILYLIPILLFSAVTLQSQKVNPVFRANSELVEVTFTISDQHGKYFDDLRKEDLRVLEDGREQTVQNLYDEASLNTPGEQPPQSVFILFDASNEMYGRFSHAEDCIARFIRGLDAHISAAVYSFTRNVTRLSPLGLDRTMTISRLRQAIAGDDTALFDSILVALRDAEKIPGKRTIVVFSNGPDNSSMLAPESVAQVAENDGVPIYVISTQLNDERTATMLGWLTNATGGRCYDARLLRDQEEAFRSVGGDLKHSYTLTYCPLPNENRGFRRIEVLADRAAGYQIHARSGYTAGAQDLQSNLDLHRP